MTMPKDGAQVKLESAREDRIAKIKREANERYIEKTLW